MPRCSRCRGPGASVPGTPPPPPVPGSVTPPPAPAPAPGTGAAGAVAPGSDVAPEAAMPARTPPSAPLGRPRLSATVVKATLCGVAVTGIPGDPDDARRARHRAGAGRRAVGADTGGVVDRRVERTDPGPHDAERGAPDEQRGDGHPGGGHAAAQGERGGVPADPAAGGDDGAGRGEGSGVVAQHELGDRDPGAVTGAGATLVRSLGKGGRIGSSDPAVPESPAQPPALRSRRSSPPCIDAEMLTSPLLIGQPPPNVTLRGTKVYS